VKQRVIVPELLDTAAPADAAASLADLRRLNRWFGGQRILRRQLAGVAPEDGRFAFVDVGAGSGDAALLVRRLYPRAMAVSLDLYARNLALAPAPKVAADAFRLPFARVDIIHAALFLHHFSDADVVRLLSEFRARAGRAVIIQDLHRHWIPHSFLPATRWLFGWHPVTLHDGPVSVAAAFRRAELAALARRAGLKNFQIRWHPFAFRWSLTART